MRLPSAKPFEAASVPARHLRSSRGRDQDLPRGVMWLRGRERRALRGAHRLAFAGMVLFSLLLYLRLHEIFPEVFGWFSLMKVVGTLTIVTYLVSKLSRGEPLTIWPLELKMVILIWVLGLLFMPVALDPGRSIEALDPFLRVVAIFWLMINLLDTRERLCLILRVIVLCSAVLGLGAIRSYLAGEFNFGGTRIQGLGGGLFGNPNDLALCLNLVLPLAVVLALSQRGLWRLVYAACAAAMVLGIVVTFSRSGFLGLMIAGAVLLWKLGSQSRVRTVALALLASVILVLAMPSRYGDRVVTIFRGAEADPTGSAQERQALMMRAASLAVRRSIIGVGMGNFPIYSIHEKVAHNSYLEITAELGVAGLLAYLTLIIAPLRSLRRIERQTKRAGPAPDRELHCLGVGFQAVVATYIVCSSFGSVQYLWYLYYPVAYAVALRRIRAAEEEEETAVSSQSERRGLLIRTGQTKGVLWPSARMRKGILMIPASSR